MKAVILKLTANQITVWYNKHSWQVFAPNKWKLKRVLKAGDWVELSQGVDGYQITKLFEAYNGLDKPKVNNLDHLVYVVAATQPELNWLQLMKTLAYYENTLNFRPMIVFTKTDLLTKDEQRYERINQLKKIGYLVFDKNIKYDWLALKKHLSKKVTCFIGQSGVGKSTLINSYQPTCNLEIGAISKKLNRGKNTTTQTQLVPFLGGFLVDTPGYTRFDYLIPKLKLATAFHDFRNWAVNCKYSNCLHDQEKDCAIKTKLQTDLLPQWRYDCYLKMLKEK